MFTRKCRAAAVKVNHSKHQQNANKKIGLRFGRLVVVSIEHKETFRLICKCDCGKYTSVRHATIISGHTKSCGCLRNGGTIRPKTRRKMREKYVGKRFGRLVVQKLIYKASKAMAICLCDCGTRKSVEPSSLTRKLTVSCGCYRTEQVLKRCISGTQHSYNWIYKTDAKRIVMKSSYELMFAEILDAESAVWEYEPQTFIVGHKQTYTPDFRVGNKYYEVKGRFYGKRQQDSIKKFRNLGYSLEMVFAKDIEAKHSMTICNYIKKYKSTKRVTRASRKKTKPVQCRNN